MANFSLTAGKDTITGTGQNDIITGTIADWQATDTINGNGGYEQMVLTAAGASAITDAMFQHVSGVQVIDLSGKGPVAVKLDTAAAASGLYSIDGSQLSGNLTVDASTSINAIDVTASKGADTLTGGMGDDYFYFTGASLNGKDKINGGGFGDTDHLVLTDKAKITDAAFAHVTSVEHLILGGYGDLTGRTVILGKLSTAAGIDEVDMWNGSGAVVDASARAMGLTFHGSDGNDVFQASQGDDSFVGGAGNDSYQVKEAQFNSKDTIDGGIGRDDIRLLDSGIAITDADFANVHGVETLAFNAAGKQTVSLSALAAQSGLDTIDASKTSGGLTLTLDNGMTRNLTIDLGKGADHLTLGNGSQHTVVMKSTSLTAADHLTGNVNDHDTLKFIDAVKLTDKFFLNAVNTSNFDTLVLDSSAKGQSLVAGDNLKVLATSHGLGEIWADSASKAASVTFDFSKYTGPALLVVGSGGSDVFIGGPTDNIFVGGSADTDQGMADSFRFHSADYTSKDFVFGGKSTADELVILDDAATIADQDFQHTQSVEILRLAAAKSGSYEINLGVNAQNTGIATVDASKAGVTVDIDAHSMTTGTTILAGGKDNSLIGNKGDDVFAFDAKTLNAGDFVNGGSSIHGDTLKLTTAGTVTAAALENINNIEKIQLSDLGNAIAVKDSFIDTAETVTTTVAGYMLPVPLLIETGKGKDTVDLSQLVTHVGQVAVLGSAGDKYITSGHDTVVFQKPADLTATTQIVGTGADVVLAAGTYAAAQFHGLHNINSFTLSDVDPTANHVLSFDNTDLQNFGGAAYIYPAYGVTGNLTVDASAATALNVGVHVEATSGDNTLKGAGGADYFTFEFDSNGHSELDAGDTVAGGGGQDWLDVKDSNVSGTATLTDTDISHVSSIETLALNGGTGITWNLTLDSAFEAAGISTIYLGGAGGAVKIDASTYVTDLLVESSAGETVLCGTGNDTVAFSFGGRDLDNTVTIAGGAGHNSIELSGLGDVVDADFIHVSLFQEIDIWGKNNVTLGVHSDAAGITTVDAGNAAYGVSLDGSGSHLDLALSGTFLGDLISGGSGADHLTGGGGGDVLFGNGGNDVFVYKSAADSYQLAGGNLSHADIIADFHAGDELDIHALVNAVTGVTNLGNVGTFATADAAGLFAGNAVAVAFNGTDTRVYVDVNHDGNFNVGHDLVVQVSGNHVAELANTASYA